MTIKAGESWWVDNGSGSLMKWWVKATTDKTVTVGAKTGPYSGYTETYLKDAVHWVELIEEDL